MIRSQKEGEAGENSPLESALKGLQSIIPSKYKEPKNAAGEVDPTQPMLVVQNDLAGETVNFETMHDLEFE